MRRDNEREGYGGAHPGGPPGNPGIFGPANPDALGPSPVVGDTTTTAQPDFPAPPSAPPPPFPPSNPIQGTFARPGSAGAAPFRTPAFNAAARFQGGTEGPLSFGPGAPLATGPVPVSDTGDEEDDILAQLFAAAAGQVGR